MIELQEEDRLFNASYNETEAFYTLECNLVSFTLISWNGEFLKHETGNNVNAVAEFAIETEIKVQAKASGGRLSISIVEQLNLKKSTLTRFFLFIRINKI